MCRAYAWAMDEKPEPELRWDGEKAGYFDEKGVERWTVLPAEIVLIAEYTTPDGPAEDYFLVIWTVEQGVLMSVRCPFDGSVEKVLDELSKVLSFQRQSSLANVTEWDSLVIWPPELAGEEYFTFLPVKAKHWWGTLYHRLMETKEYRVSDRVMTYLKSKKAKA